MIELPVPKDISQYESKLIGPLTARQSLCAAIAVGLIVFVQMKVPIPNSDIKSMICILFAVLPFSFTLKIYGVYMERFLQTAFISMFVAPKVRKYKTENLFDDGKPQMVIGPTFYMNDEEKAEYLKVHTTPKGKPIKVKIDKKYLKEHPELKGFK